MATIFDFARGKTEQPEEEVEEEVVVAPEAPKKRSIFDVARENKAAPVETPPKLPERIKPKEEPKYAFEQENDLEREIERHQARSTSRFLETLAGAPGDIENFGHYLLSSLGAAQLETEAPKEKYKTFLPTGEDIQKKTEKFGQGYLTAQNELEEAGDEFFKDLAAYSIPGTGQGGVVRNIGIPLVSNLVKQGLVHTDTAGDKGATAAKVGTMFLLDLMNARKNKGFGGARGYASHLFNESEKAIPQGAKVAASEYVNSLDRLEKNLLKGGTSPSKEPALKKIKELKDKTQGGDIAIEELTGARKAINDIIESGGGFEFHPPKGTRNKAINNLNDVKKVVIDELNKYGNINPQFGKLNRAANEAYAVTSKSNVVHNFLKKNFGDKIENSTLKTLLGLGGTAGAGVAFHLLPTTTAAAAASVPLYQAMKVGYRVYNSPVLRKYYSDLLKHAIAGNVEATAANVKLLDRALMKEDKEREKRVSELKKTSKTNKKKQKNNNR